ncbi:MAG: sugar phosphate isomerase/epimerase family protein [Anaerolineae bacterium]
MKFAVFTVMMPEYCPAEAVALLAELGYDGVEWRVTRPNAQPDLPPAYWSNNRCTVDIATLDREADALSMLTRSAGLEMPSLGTYLGCQDLDDIERAMRAAAGMGCPRLRVSPPRYDRAVGYGRLFAQALGGYVEVEELARKTGVQACIEIHMGNICSSPSLGARLVSYLDPRYIGVILDPGNMIYEGYEDWRMGMEVLGPYLAHVHLKNSQWLAVGQRDTGETDWRASAAAMDRGIIDMRQFMSDLRAVGYDGYCSFEDFSDSGTTEEKLKRNLEYIRTL